MFKEWRVFPAHFALLFAVVTERCRSSEDVVKVSKQYSVPTPFDRGLQNLIAKGVLVGNLSDFDVAPALREVLPAWLEANRQVIDELIKYYRRQGMRQGRLGDAEEALGLRIQV